MLFLRNAHKPCWAIGDPTVNLHQYPFLLIPTLDTICTTDHHPSPFECNLSLLHFVTLYYLGIAIAYPTSIRG